MGYPAATVCNGSAARRLRWRGVLLVGGQDSLRAALPFSRFFDLLFLFHLPDGHRPPPHPLASLQRSERERRKGKEEEGRG